MERAAGASAWCSGAALWLAISQFDATFRERAYGPGTVIGRVCAEAGCGRETGVAAFRRRVAPMVRGVPHDRTSAYQSLQGCRFDDGYRCPPWRARPGKRGHCRKAITHHDLSHRTLFGKLLA